MQTTQALEASIRDAGAAAVSRERLCAWLCETN